MHCKSTFEPHSGACVYLCGRCRHCSAQPQGGPLEPPSNWSPDSGLQPPSSEVHAHGSPTLLKHFWARRSLASWHRGSGTPPVSLQTEERSQRFIEEYSKILDSFFWTGMYEHEGQYACQVLLSDYMKWWYHFKNWRDSTDKSNAKI